MVYEISLKLSLSKDDKYNYMYQYITLVEVSQNKSGKFSIEL